MFSFFYNNILYIKNIIFLAWYQRSYLNIKNFLLLLFFDLKSMYFDLKKILKKPIFLFFLPFLLVFIQFWLVIFVVIYLFSFFYYVLNFYYNFFTLKKYEYGITNPYIYNYKKKIITNKNYHHIYYYFYKLPQLTAFKNFYIIFKNIYFKLEFNNFLFMFILILLILPFRFLIKIITGFNYICIKISLNLLSNIIDIFRFNCENLTVIYDNLFIDLYCSYINPIISDVISYKIYWDGNKIHFNPFEDKIKMIFKDLPALKRSLYFSNKIFKLRFLQTSKITGHPSFTAFINDKNFKELTAVIQSSKQFRPILNSEKIMLKDKADIELVTGVLGKNNVYDHRPVTIDLVNETVKLKSIDDWNNIVDPDLQKKIALKTLYASFYKKDLILENGQVTESLEFNLYVERLYALYKNNELTDDAYNAISYLLEFSYTNDIIHNSIKQKLWNYLFENSIITENDVIIPNFEFEKLPIDLKNMIEMFE